MIISKKCPNCSEISTQDVSTPNCPVCGVFYAKKDKETERNIPITASPTSIMRKKSIDEKFCVECGTIIRSKAEICPSCGVRQPAIEGVTWLRNNNMPQLIALIGIMFWLFPGLAFIAWAWGKYKCPKCGKVGENIPA